MQSLRFNRLLLGINQKQKHARLQRWFLYGASGAVAPGPPQKCRKAAPSLKKCREASTTKKCHKAATLKYAAKKAASKYAVNAALLKNAVKQLSRRCHIMSK